MPIGTTKSSRLITALLLLFFGILLLFSVPLLQWFANSRVQSGQTAFNFVAFWPAIYLVSIAIFVSMLTVVIANLIPLNATGEGELNFLGLKMPVNLKGASLLLLLLGLAVGFATVKWDLTGITKLSDALKAATRKSSSVTSDLNKAEAQRDMLLTILGGKRHQKGIEVLKLVVACGASSQNTYTNWEHALPGKKFMPVGDPEKPLIVSSEPHTYGMTQNGTAIISVDVEFTDAGVIVLALNHGTSVTDYCRYIDNPPTQGFSAESVEHLAVQPEQSQDSDQTTIGFVETSSKRDG